MGSIIDACVEYEREKENEVHLLLSALKKYPKVLDTFNMWIKKRNLPFGYKSAQSFLNLYGFSLKYSLNTELAYLCIFILGRKLTVATVKMKRGMEYVEILEAGFKFIEDFHDEGIINLTVAGNNIWIVEQYLKQQVANNDVYYTTDYTVDITGTDKEEPTQGISKSDSLSHPNMKIDTTDAPTEQVQRENWRPSDEVK